MNVWGHMDELKEAANAGDVARVRQLLQRLGLTSGTDAENFPDRTAVASAPITFPIDEGPGLALTNSDGSTALHDAATWGHGKVVVILKKYGATVNQAKDDGRTPLHCAAHHGHPDVAELLLKFGADINIVDNAGWTPLHCAAAMGHLEVARVLLSSGADISKTAETGATPVHVATENGHTKMVEMLLHTGSE